MKKRLLFILILLFGMTLLFSCNDGPGPDSIEPYTVEEGIAAIEDAKEYTVELEFKTYYNQDKTDYDDIKVKIDCSNNEYKFTLEVEDMSYSVYLYEIVETTSTRLLNQDFGIVFNTSILQIGYDVYVKTTISEVISLLFVTPDVDIKDNPELNEYQEVFAAFEELILFFTDLKNEYFNYDENQKAWYFNSAGKEAFIAAFTEFANSIPDNDITVEELGINIELTAKTDEKYLTDLSVLLTADNLDDGDPIGYQLDIHYSNFDNTKVEIPTEAITLTEFLEIMQNGGAATTSSTNTN